MSVYNNPVNSGINSFFRFVLGFTVFIAVSFGLTYAVTTYAVSQEKEQQVASAFQTLLGHTPEKENWRDRIF